MSYAIHCDNARCDTWTLNPEDSDFLTLTYSDGDERHYCSQWCCVVSVSVNAEPSQEFTITIDTEETPND